MNRTALAGIGAIGFSVLIVAATLVSSPAGGNYKASDVADYVAKGHRTAVFISVYLALLGVFGLFLLLARLRDAVAPGPLGLGSIYWALGVGGATCFAAGWSVIASVPLAMTYGGSGVTLETTVVYTITEAGWVIFFGAGGMLLGLALVALVLESSATLPGWIRVVTLIAGLGGIGGVAFFPFFLVLIWGLVIGVWLLLTGSRTAHAVQ